MADVEVPGTIFFVFRFNQNGVYAFVVADGYVESLVVEFQIGKELLFHFSDQPSLPGLLIFFHPCVHNDILQKLAV